MMVLADYLAAFLAAYFALSEHSTKTPLNLDECDPVFPLFLISGNSHRESNGGKHGTLAYLLDAEIPALRTTLLPGP